MTFIRRLISATGTISLMLRCPVDPGSPRRRPWRRLFALPLALLAGSLAAGAAAQAGYVTDGLVAYYDSRDQVINGIGRGSGTTWLDRSGSANNGTLQHSPPGGMFIEDVAGASQIGTISGQSGAIEPFTQDVLLTDSDLATGRRVEMAVGANGVNTPTGLTGITVEVFARTNHVTSNSLSILMSSIGERIVGGNPRLFALEVNPPNRDLNSDNSYKVRWNVFSDNPKQWYSVQSDAAIPDNRWIHILGVFNPSDDPSQIKLYLNGVQQTQTNSVTGPLNSEALGTPSIGAIFNLGGEEPPTGVDGAIGFSRIYTRGLTTQEVATNWADAQVFAVPEPGGLALAGVGIAAAAARLVRRGRGPKRPPAAPER